MKSIFENNRKEKIEDNNPKKSNETFALILILSGGVIEMIQLLNIFFKNNSISFKISDLFVEVLCESLPHVICLMMIVAGVIVLSRN